MAEPVVVIGIGVDGRSGLSAQSLNLIQKADQLWGSRRLLDQFVDYQGTRVELGSGIGQALSVLKNHSADQLIVVLASGDPGFFGVGSSLLEILPAEQVRLIPQVSSLQAAFAKAHLSWHDAHFTSAHARQIHELIGYAKRFCKLGVLTDPDHHPAWLAEKLLAAGVEDCRVIICENLGDTAEEITETRLGLLQGRTFSPLNVMLLVHPDDWQPGSLYPNRPDVDYAHRNGLITKADIRALCLARMEIGEMDTLWDIGAGSGAVSIEMAERAWRGQVFAVEKDAQCLGFIHENINRYGIVNVEVVTGEAPTALHDLPIPQAIFIGGSNRQLAGILNAVEHRVKSGCRVVATFAILENLIEAYHHLQNAGWPVTVTQVQQSTSSPLSDGIRLMPSNATFIVTGRKP